MEYIVMQTIGRYLHILPMSGNFNVLTFAACPSPPSLFHLTSLCPSHFTTNQRSCWIIPKLHCTGFLQFVLLMICCSPLITSQLVMRVSCRNVHFPQGEIFLLLWFYWTEEYQEHWTSMALGSPHQSQGRCTAKAIDSSQLLTVTVHGHFWSCNKWYNRLTFEMIINVLLFWVINQIKNMKSIKLLH